MKVWELIAELMELPAGLNVACTAYPEGTVNTLVSVNVEDDEVVLRGSGEYTDDLDEAASREDERNG